MDQGRIWFRARDALYSYDPMGQAWHIYTLHTIPTSVSAVSQIQGEILVIRDGSTLTRFDTEKRQVEHVPIPFGSGWHHLSPSNDTIWFGGESSTLLSLDRQSWRWREHPLARECIGELVSALVVRGNALWVSGQHGTIRYDLQSGNQRCLTQNSGMLSDEAAQIVDMGPWVWFVHPWRGAWAYVPRKEIKR
jgi:hypothetical protein